MSDPELLAAATDGLRGYLESIVGPGAIPHFEEALTTRASPTRPACRTISAWSFSEMRSSASASARVLAAAHTDADEGKLTRMRSALVNAAAIASWARRVGLGDCIRFGRGAKSGGEREQTNVLADALWRRWSRLSTRRARPVRSAIPSARHRRRPAEKAEALSVLDPSSALQERAQSGGKPAPTYRVLELRGAAHAQVFEVEVMVADCSLARGEGRSKRLAERAAVAAALEVLEKEASEAPQVEGEVEETEWPRSAAPPGLLLLEGMPGRIAMGGLPATKSCQGPPGCWRSRATRRRAAREAGCRPIRGGKMVAHASAPTFRSSRCADLYFVLDVSGSMLDNGKWGNVRTAVADLVRGLARTPISELPYFRSRGPASAPRGFRSCRCCAPGIGAERRRPPSSRRRR